MVRVEMRAGVGVGWPGGGKEGSIGRGRMGAEAKFVWIGEEDEGLRTLKFSDAEMSTTVVSDLQF